MALYGHEQANIVSYFRFYSLKVYVLVLKIFWRESATFMMYAYNSYLR